MADRYLVWALVSVIIVLSVVFAAAGIRRRLERGQPARFHIGFGAGLVNAIEGLSGRELSPRARAIVLAVSIAIALIALMVGLSVLLSRGGAQ